MKRQNETAAEGMHEPTKVKPLSPPEPSDSSDLEASSLADRALPPATFSDHIDVEDRIDAGSLQKEVEEFEKLTPVAKYVQFRTQAYEIKQLRRKLRKSDTKQEDKLEGELQRAKDVTAACASELPDQRALVPNTLRALGESFLIPNTLQYNRICTIIRNALSISASHSQYLALPDKTVPISRKEGEEFMKLPNSLEVYRALLGEAGPARPGMVIGECERAEAGQYFRLQAEALKKMTFRQFVSSMARARAQH